MYNLKKKKLTAYVLAAFMTVSVLGTTIASAHPHDNPPPPPPRHDHNNHHDKGHSSGEVTTAAILGAVAGAVIAKNT